jgi:hypothetical protein
LIILPEQRFHLRTDTMALFNWFSKKSDSGNKAAAHVSGQQTKHVHSTPPASTIPPSGHSRPATDSTNRSEERKAKRQMRREQLYSAIRQAMTRAGVLSASFKFKVLSLDQRGDQFLVKIDVLSSLGLQEDKLLENEALVIEVAKTQFGILVTAVYWRIDTSAESGKLARAGRSSSPAPLSASTATSLQPAHGQNKPPARYEPIEDDEVAAFKRALATSTAARPAARAAAVPSAQSLAAADSPSKNRSGLRSYTLITGFEDTEMPESAAVPALSATQYGDLN